MLHIIHGSGLTSRFRPPEGRSIRFLSPLAKIRCVHFVSVWCSAPFLAEKSSDVASVASHHPQHLPPTSYYQTTFNPYVTASYRAMTRRSATRARWICINTHVGFTRRVYTCG